MKASSNLILLIEDNTENLENFTEILELEGYGVIACRNGEQGISMIRSKLPSLIISDIKLPGISGFDIITSLKVSSQTETIPFMFLSATSERKAINKGIALGASSFLVKPCPIEQILTSKRNILSPVGNYVR